MINALARTIFYLMFAIGITAPLFACAQKAPSITNGQAQLKELFATLYLGDHGLDYPPSEATLQLCKSNKNESCLQVYDLVKSAAQKLVAMKSETALAATFDVIRRSCGSADENTANFICHGALMSFYFYSEIEYDSKILGFIETLPISTQSEIMNSGLAWLHNRPAPKRWLEYLNSAPIEWQFEGSKEQATAMLSNKIAPPLWAQR